jgi:two-component system response regulator PilR (NtrC family)
VNRKHSILFVDDEPGITIPYGTALRDEGLEVVTTNSALEALEHLRGREFDVVISDINMREMSGVDLLTQGKKLAPATIFIMITGYASTETAIDALQHGAYDYLTKPIQMAELRNIVRNAAENRSLRREVASLKKEAEATQSQKLFQALHRNQIVGKSPKMLDVFRTIGTVAAGDSTVLVTGESGTGKELVARALHEASPRRAGPFVSINCGAFPETLLESELFGYMRGAFTGAVTNKQGLFEAARGGTIFLDEIGEMTPAMQVKLLRVLQERKLRPLGGTTEVGIDVRVVAATNRDFKEAIARGQFREDLYYRIAVITIRVPPLRERPEDIDMLAFHFLRLYAERSGKPILGIASDALRCLESYAWPGNVRELENTVERAVTLETGEMISLERLPEAVRGMTGATPESRGQATNGLEIPTGPFDLDAFLATLEKLLVCQALERAGGNQTVAADYLKLTKPSLRHKIQALGIEPAAFKRGAS